MTKTLSKKPLLDNIRRGELKRLLLHRKVSKLEVHNMVEDIIAERARWTAPALGQRVNLTFNEKIGLAIRTIACIDRSKKIMRLYFREKKRERDRRRWERRRQMPTSDLSLMAKWLTDRLAAGEWVRAADLVEHLRKSRRHRKREAARSAVRRALRELAEANSLDIETLDRPQGGFERFVRLKKPKDIAVLQSSMQKKPVNIQVFGEASIFRPPVKRPPVKYSSLHQRSSKEPVTTQARFAAKNTTRPIDSYYPASAAKAALPQRGGRARGRPKAVGLEGDRPDEPRARPRKDATLAGGDYSAREGPSSVGSASISPKPAGARAMRGIPMPT